MKIIGTYLLLWLLLAMLAGCEKWTEQEKFRRPDWLPGKLYTTVSVQSNLSMFAECLKLAGLDSVLDVSGSWTVFAPDNNAMQQYLAEHHFAQISDIPRDELVRLAKFHVIQNPWSYEQLTNLGMFGWLTEYDGRTNPLTFKRQTMFRNPIEKYWIKRTDQQEKIVLDSLDSDTYKKVYVQSRKYVPVFYDEYMAAGGITSGDFRFYFNREYEPGNVYYAGAKIAQRDIFAENGFVHVIDRVVEPMKNADEFLKTELPGESYRLFLEMVYWYYPDFDANLTATMSQPEVRSGGLIDTLWDLQFNPVSFNLHDELIGTFSQTLTRHNGLFAPTDGAFTQFIDNILTAKSGFPHWRDIRSLPQDVANLIVLPHFTTSPIYPSSDRYRQIFREKGRFRQDEESIIRTEFGSNCTFIGIDNYIPDKAFTSVSGPVYCRPNFSTFRLALQYTDIDDIIANHDGPLSFFPIPDYALKADSSLLVKWTSETNYYFYEYNRTKHLMENLSYNSLRNRILNQIGTALPTGATEKEKIPTLGGRYIIWNNKDSTVQGRLPSTIGYGGDIVVVNQPSPLPEPVYNGKVWSVRYWFNN